MDLPVSKINTGPTPYYRVTVDYGNFDIMDYYFRDQEGLKDACILFNYAIQNGFKADSAKCILNEDDNIYSNNNNWEEYSLRS